MEKSDKKIREWFPLYAADWMTCIELRVCSIAARGLLIELMAYSWNRGHPGVITEDPEIMARYLGLSLPDYLTYLEELDYRDRIDVEWDSDGASMSLLGGDRVSGKPVSIVIRRLVTIGEEQAEKIAAFSNQQRERANKRWHKDAGGIPRNTAGIPNHTKREEKRGEEKRREESNVRDGKPSEVAEYWNSLCEASGLRSIRAWNDSRRRALRARMRDGWFAENWQEIFAAAHRSAWCREKRAGIEHVLRPENAMRYYEAMRPVKPTAPAGPERISMVIRYSDGRDPDYYRMTEQELAETIERIGLVELDPIEGERQFVVDEKEYQ